MNNVLKNRREKADLTQVQVAEKARITARGYQYIESGGRVPNAHTAQLIARALGSTVEELFPLPKWQFKAIEKEPDGNRAK